MKQRTDQIRIFISDLEAVYRKGIRWTLSGIESFEIVGEATTNIETLESIMKTPVDLLILNINHNKPSGIDVTRYVSHQLPDIKVILMMDDYNTKYIVEAMKSGAKVCINKSINLDDLIHTISQVIHDELPIGHYLLSPKVADFVLKEYEVSNQMTEKNDRAHIRLVKSEQMILNRIRENISLTDLPTRLGISREILNEYLDEIAEKLVRVEYYNETPGQRYISNLISKRLGETTVEQDNQPGDRILNYQTGEIESYIPDNLTPIDSPWYDEKERRNYVTKKQSTEINEPVNDMTGIIELARKAGRLSSIHEFNRYIMSITEGLMMEIDRRRRNLRRLKKAIEFETAIVRNSDSTWN
jgi:DNA-binding NarL/FixJ family response regulator